MKKHFRKIASVALASVLCMAMVGTAFAADPATGTENEPAKAYVTKELQLPEGTTVPSAAFTFNVTPVSVDGNAYDQSNMPSGDATITYSSTTTVDKTADGVQYAVKDAQLFANYTWPHAGVYVYTIKEADSGLTEDSNDKTTETMNYSQAEYTATVYVVNGEDGLYVKYISVVQTKDDAGNAVTPDQGSTGKKVDPDQPDPTDPTDPSKGGALRFVNTYTKKISVDPVDPGTPDPDKPGDTDSNDAALSVKKIVSGDLGDKTKGFEFTVTVTAPSLSGQTTIPAKIVSIGRASEDVTFTSGTAQTVSLKHGQELVFTEMYVGASYSVQETDTDANHTAKTYSVRNSGDVTEQNGKVAVTGKVTEGNDLVSVVNHRGSATPGGVLVNNLPFVLMVAVAVAGFASYIMIRRRRQG